MLKRLRDAVWFCSCGAGWQALRDLFLRASSTLEPELLSKGQMSRWWLLSLLYWIADTVFIALIAYLTHGPLKIRPWRAIPLLQLVSDAAVLVLFFHLYLLSTDRVAAEGLASVGLDTLPHFLIAVMIVWLLVAVLKWRSFGEANDVEQRSNLMRKTRNGRRTTVLSKVQLKQFGISPK